MSLDSYLIARCIRQLFINAIRHPEQACLICLRTTTELCPRLHQQLPKHPPSLSVLHSRDSLDEVFWSRETHIASCISQDLVRYLNTI